MDMQKKLEQAYFPDKETRKKRLVVGLSGGINSFVAAYLLKIQKFELIGVTIATGWEQFPGKQEKILSCHLPQSRIDTIKEFCHQLGISHLLVKAQDEFREEVVDQWLGNRLVGTKSSPCWNCHELRMRLLHQKMIELEAQGMASGHLAKIFKHDAHQSVYVHSSNDEQHDQSDFLSRLPHEILDKLHLPLSDLQQKEIIRLAENFGLTSRPTEVSVHQCLNLGSESGEVLRPLVPSSYLVAGDIVDGTNSYGDHSGVVNFYYGQMLDSHRNRGQELFVNGYSSKEGKISVARDDYFQRKKIFLNRCHVSEETSWAEPMKGFIKSSAGLGECWIYPKNLASALVELEHSHRFLEGEIVTVYKKKGKNAKVYLTGIVRFIEEPEGQGDDRAKVDHTRDF